MKKIVIWMLCAMLLLSGCRAAAQPTEPGTSPMTEPTATMPTELVTEPLPTVTEPAPAETIPAPTEPAVDDAEYEILRLDHSVRNDSDAVIVLFYYDKVILNGAFDRINRILSEAAVEFVTGTDIGALAEQAEQMGVTPEYPFLNHVTAEVTHNADGILSIMLTRDWYAGGVGNTDYDGMTFSLREDRALTLTELFPEVTEEQLKTIVWDALTAEFGDAMFEGVYEDLQAYGMEDFLFYIREGELILTFPTYTFGPGAAGAMTVPTGLYIGG